MRLELLQTHDDKIFSHPRRGLLRERPTTSRAKSRRSNCSNIFTGDSPAFSRWRVHGDSMFPDIGDGDCVIVNSNRAPKFGERIVASSAAANIH